VGIVAAATAVTLYVLSDDPHRYDGFVQPNPEAAPAADKPAEKPEQKDDKAEKSSLRMPQIGVSPLPGGAFASLGLQF
jgi:hypothetical protein